MKYFVIGYALALMTATASTAMADESENMGVMSCDSPHNAFTIRFGRWWNNGPIEQVDLVATDKTVEQQWPFTNLTFSADCVFANGLKASFKTGEGQAFAYGMGGADPDAFIYLDVDDRHVYYKRVFYAGYGSGVYTLGALTYRDGALYECPAYNDKKTEKPATSSCTDVSARLAGTALTPPELVALKADQERRDLTANLPRSCDEMREHFVSAPIKGANKIGVGYLSEYEVDIDNDGKIDRVFRISGGDDDCASCGTHYFDGSFLVAFAKDNKNAERFVQFLTEQDGSKFDLEQLPALKELSEWGGDFISQGLAGSSIRYVYNVPFIASGVTYIYSFESNRDKIPPVVISKITPDHKVQMICKFATPEDR